MCRRRFLLVPEKVDTEMQGFFFFFSTAEILEERATQIQQTLRR